MEKHALQHVKNILPTRLRALTTIIGCMLIVSGFYLWHSPREQGTIIGSMKFNVEFASSPEERIQGLSNRPHMPSDAAMLFTYEAPGIHCLWMKDMMFALDMIWLNEAGKVITIHRNVQPETYPDTYCPTAEAAQAIELRAGMADKAGISVGDDVNIQK